MTQYCDHFDPLFDDSEDHFIGFKEVSGGGGSGGDGGYYRPSVSSDGTLSWTPSSGGMPPVASQNIRGPQGNIGPVGPVGPPGEAGKGLTIKGYYASLAELRAAVPYPSEGDAYGVGMVDPYDIYVWDSEHLAWVNNGALQGPKGDPFTYADFTPAQLESLRGPQGVQGVKGDPFTYADFTPAQLEALRGPQGIKGDKGDTGATGTTYTPAVSSAGVLSWTNDGGKANPQSVDLVAAVLAALPNGDGVSY